MKVYLKCAFGIEIWDEEIDYYDNGVLTKRPVRGSIA
jgi:hypothetical protein